MKVNEGFFRFHNTKHLEEVVLKNGYIEGEIGERSKTDHETEKRIYFSQGMVGIYKIASKEILDLIYRDRGFDKRQEEIYQNFEKEEERLPHILQLEQELKAIRLDDVEKEQIFSKLKTFYENQTYMVLDLQQDEDYSPADNWNFANMHTKEGIIIPENKIKILGVLKENVLETNGFEILKNIYAKYREAEGFEESLGKSYYIELLDEYMKSSTLEQDKTQDLKIMSLEEYKQVKNRVLPKTRVDRGKDDD